MLCARLESVASMLETRSAAVGEAQLRAILLEHQSALEAQQLAQAKTLTLTLQCSHLQQAVDFLDLAGRSCPPIAMLPACAVRLR